MAITSNEERTANRLGDLERQLDAFISQDKPGSQLFTAGYVPFGGTNGALLSDSAFQWDNTNKALKVNNINPGGILDISNTGVSTASWIELGAKATGNRFAYIDLHGDDTYTDYSARFLRGSSGANAPTSLAHRGTGVFSLDAIDAAHIIFNINGAPVIDVYPGGNVVLAGNLYPTNQATYYLSYDGSSSLYTNGNLRAAGHFFPDNGVTSYLGLSGASLYTNAAFIAGGNIYPGNQGSYYLSFAGNSSLGINGDLQVGSAIAVSGSHGIVTIGDQSVDYNPTTGTWLSGGTTLLLSAANYSTIGFHDAGTRVDFIRVGGGVMQLGYNGGYGNGTIEMLGQVGIGTVAAAANKLYIKGVDATSSNGALLVQNSAGTTLMQNRDDNVNSVGTAWVVLSDSDLKKDIKPLAHGINKLRGLLPKEYKTKLGDYPMFGLIAQDVASVFPELVVDLGGLLGVRYNDLIPVLINAVVDLQDQINLLKPKA